MCLESVTVGDCIENFCRKNQIAVIENGKVIGFQKEIREEEEKQEGLLWRII